MGTGSEVLAHLRTFSFLQRISTVECTEKECFMMPAVYYSRRLYATLTIFNIGGIGGPCVSTALTWVYIEVFYLLTLYPTLLLELLPRIPHPWYISQCSV